MSTPTTLFYVHDPMCSWCYAFRPLWQEILPTLPAEISVKYVLGGLATDTDQAMPESLQQQLIATWKRIEQVVPGTQFNFDFWRLNQPRRATYPACRAVLTAKMQNIALEKPMIIAIQNAYYQQAKNPSDESVLTGLAIDLGIDGDEFQQKLNSNEIQSALTEEIAFARSIGGDSFPSLILQTVDGLRDIALSYTDKDLILKQLLN